MNFPDRNHFIQLRKELWQRPRSRAAVMVGAGFSLNARPSPGIDTGFPTWRKLARAMFDEVYPRGDRAIRDREERFNRSNPLRVASEYEAAFKRQKLESYLRTHVPDSGHQPGPMHDLLLQLPWRDVFTTNYDTLLEGTEVTERAYQPVTTVEDLTTAIPPRIVKLHGTLPSQPPFIITEEDYRTYPRRFAPFVNTVRQSLIENSFVLIGFSGDDPNFLEWIGWIRDELEDHHAPIYLTGLLSLDHVQRSLLARRGVTPIDLAPVFPNQSESPASAIKWFLENLKIGRPPSPHRWPNGTTVTQETRDYQPALLLDGLSEPEDVRPDQDALLPALEAYPEAARNRLTVYKPACRDDAIWLHPGEPVFDGISSAILGRFGDDALRGAVFVDPYASEAYLFHVALVSVQQCRPDDDGAGTAATARLLESRLIGLRQTSDDTVEESPVERLLLLRGADGFAPGGAPLASRARGMLDAAADFAREEVTEGLAHAHRQRLAADLPSRVEFVNRGFDFQAADLAAMRARLTAQARAGADRAQEDLIAVKERQRTLTATRARRLAELHAEAHSIQPGEVEFLVHALVVPAHDHKEVERFDAEVEALAVQVAAAHEARSGAEVKDVSRPDQARRAGLTDWPGFDLLSDHPDGERRCIEVKGRAAGGSVEVSDNEWAKACNLRDEYWLYVVYDCATPRPRLMCVHDPFAKLLIGNRQSLAYTVTPGAVLEAAE